MLNLTFWFQRKKAALCILTGICAVSLFVISNSNEKVKQNTGGAYVIKIKHYGIDAAEMEKSITIPLEDALFSIPGVLSIQSSSENSQSSVFIRFKKDTKGLYEAVRDAAQRVYETLPSSAQRPEIISSNNSRIPVWSAAVITDDLSDAAHILDKIVKPRFESLEGTGEVLVSGIGLKEINISLDQEKLAALGLEPSLIATTLSLNDSIFSGGTIIQGNKEIIVTVDGRYSSLNNALINIGDGKIIQLSDIAQITELEREPDILSRLNGSKTTGIAIMGRDGADLRKLSNDIKKEISVLSLPLNFTVLSDLGAEERAAFKSVFNAALIGAIMVSIISFLLCRNNNFIWSGLFCALSIPIICLISISFLSLSGFLLNGFLLAGIAAGIGTAIDSVILCSEKLRKCVCYNSASVSLTSLTGPLIAGSFTTVAALIPLFSIEEGGIKIIASAIAVVTLISLILSLTILPPLLLWGINSKKSYSRINPPQIIGLAGRRLSHLMSRFLTFIVKRCISYPLIVLFISITIIITGFFLLAVNGVDTSNYNSEDSVYAQVEFDGGLLAEEVDRLLTAYSRQLTTVEGVKNVETGARIGTGSLLISFDPKQTHAHIIRETAKNIYIPGGFVFFHENSIKDRYWEIIIYGDEDKKCRELAEELAYLCSEHPLIRERVLNFKKGSNKLILLPDREILSESKISFSNAAARIRLGVYGPVSYKRIDSNKEIDVRIKTNISFTRQSKEGALGLLVQTNNKESIAYLPISSLMQTKEEAESSSIKRDNRRRAASITISTKVMDARRVKKELSGLLNKIDLPPGYSIEFDPQAIKQSEKLSATVFSLVLAVVFCYMIIASINESLFIPLLILCAIPPSLSIPALYLVLSGSTYNSAVACAFIVVSGLTVNAAILCVDSIKSRVKPGCKNYVLYIYLALRKKIPALLSTTGTTVAGAIPFFFLKEGANTLIRTLSLVSAIGVACSCICSLTVIPSLFLLFYKKSHLSEKKFIKE